MGLEIDLECRKCGHNFRHELGEVQIGRTLRCPSCSGCSLMLSGDPALNADDGQGLLST
jgi:DNA-directed RNA polymerase subunit RPC12/RpoP